MKVEEGFRLALEARRRAEEEDHTWIEAEEEARLVEEKRLKTEEEEEDIRLKAEEEARLDEGERLKVEDHEITHMKAEEGFRLALASRRRAEEEQQ